MQPNWFPLHFATLGQSTLPTLESSKPSIEDCDLSSRIDSMKHIARLNPSTIFERDKEGRTFLHYACRLDSTSLVAAALETVKEPVAFLKLANANGALPLHNTARFSESLSVLDYVVEQYPTALTERNNENLLPLHWAAAKSKNPKIIDRLVEAHPQGIREVNSEG
jgi:ankyrin repeat protein